MGQKELKAEKKDRPAPSKPSAITMAAGFFICGMLIMALAFIAPQMALMALGLMALGTFLLFEINKRRVSEHSMAAKLKAINERHERLSKDVESQRYDIMFIREDVDQLKASKKEELLAGKANDMTISNRIPLDFDPIPKAVSPLRQDRKIMSKDTKKPAKGKTAEPATTDASGLSDTVVRELVYHAVQNQRVDVFVQPVVRLPQRQTRFYEVFARIRARPGLYLPASRYMELARKDALMNQIDELLLMQCLKTIRDTANLDRAVPFFINITTATLSNKDFMRQLLAFLSKHRELGPRLIFEIRQKEFEQMQPSILEILRGLGKLGCSLSLDHVQNFAFDLKFLQVLKVRFVKVSAMDLMKKTKSDKEFHEIERLKRKLEGNGIGFIAEKIESEFTLKELLDFGINYGQGYLFGKPDLQGAYNQQNTAASH